MKNKWEEASKEYHNKVWMKSDMSALPYGQFKAGCEHAEPIVRNQVIEEVKEIANNYAFMNEFLEEIEKLKK